MNIYDLPHYQPKERATPVRHELPPTPARDENAPVVIVGTVREVRNWSARFWDDPEQNWYSLRNGDDADTLIDALGDNVKVRVTVKNKTVIGIQV